VPTLALRVSPREVEGGVSPPTGFARIEAGASQAILLTPVEIDPERRYPLITVLHGAGRQDEALAKAYRDEAEKRQALFLIPRSALPTWDLIASGERHDLDFLEYAFELIYRRYPVDFERQALIGYSDGASYGLSIALSNPRIFRAVMAWAAGFVVVDDTFVSAEDPRPAILMEHGTHDQVFPFQAIALPLRARLEAAGYKVHFRVDEGGRHFPSGDFQPEALDWFFSDPWERRS
jgi:phospholipase/carboxylesterase